MPRSAKPKYIYARVQVICTYNTKDGKLSTTCDSYVNVPHKSINALHKAHVTMCQFKEDDYIVVDTQVADEPISGHTKYKTQIVERV